jgi:hypothetical protein
MDKATQVVNELNKVQTGKSTSVASQYKKSALQAIADAYETKFDANWKPIARIARENATEAKATKANRVIDAVLENGASDIVFGDSRWILK